MYHTWYRAVSLFRSVSLNRFKRLRQSSNHLWARQLRLWISTLSNLSNEYPKQSWAILQPCPKMVAFLTAKMWSFSLSRDIPSLLQYICVGWVTIWPTCFLDFFMFSTKVFKMTAKESAIIGLRRVNYPYFDNLFVKICKFSKFQFWSFLLFRGVMRMMTGTALLLFFHSIYCYRSQKVSLDQ
mgnify:CR=1 FL=1